MRTGNALFFSVSGQRHTRRTELYDRLKYLLPAKFPGKKFEFLGNPFGRLPFPLAWNERECKQDATTRLLECWTKLNEFCCSELRPLLKTDSAILAHGFGIDALLYATACIGSETQNDEAFRLHDGLVKLRLKEQGIGAPTYFITRADVTTLDARIVHAMPKLSGIARKKRHHFIRYEEKVLEQYFRRITNQNEPHFINAESPLREMAEEIVVTIGKRL